jgi:hypothetical protein
VVEGVVALVVVDVVVVEAIHAVVDYYITTISPSLSLSRSYHSSNELDEGHPAQTLAAWKCGSCSVGDNGGDDGGLNG